jgi:SAM-dependent methyltransferase
MRAVATKLPPGMAAARRYLGRHLVGDGVELGPGHEPFPVPPVGVGVRYLDRWRPNEMRVLFPELGDDAEFPDPDIIADFDTDRLSALEDASQDFVVCSHLLEHLAEPVGFLAEIHRVLRPGGVAMILLPDLRLTFDRDRAPTTLDHLLAEHAERVTEVDDAHLADFEVGAGGAVPEDPQERAKLFESHRRRSVHVHCWTEDEFMPVIEHGIRGLGERWELVDAVLAEDWPGSIEFGFVLRRSTSSLEPAVLAKRFADAWDAWRSSRPRPAPAQDQAGSTDDAPAHTPAPARAEAPATTLHTPALLRPFERQRVVAATWRKGWAVLMGVRRRVPSG